jgi:hypothetical protein
MTTAVKPDAEFPMNPRAGFLPVYRHTWWTRPVRISHDEQAVDASFWVWAELWSEVEMIGARRAAYCLSRLGIVNSLLRFTGFVIAADTAVTSPWHNMSEIHRFRLRRRRPFVESAR